MPPVMPNYVPNKLHDIGRVLVIQQSTPRQMQCIDFNVKIDLFGVSLDKMKMT